MGRPWAHLLASKGSNASLPEPTGAVLRGKAKDTGDPSGGMLVMTFLSLEIPLRLCFTLVPTDHVREGPAMQTAFCCL